MQQSLLYSFDRKADDAVAAKSAADDEVAVVRKLYKEILTFFAQTYADVFRLNAPPAHDPLAVAAVLAPSLFFDHGERYAVHVITEGEHGSSDHVRLGSSQCGRTVATLLPANESGVRIPRSLEKEKLWRMLDDCLARVR